VIVTVLLKLANDVLKLVADVTSDETIKAEVQAVIDDIDSIISLVTGQPVPAKEKPPADD
jgi:hypothetical protein